jgi:hypothetical protein
MGLILIGDKADKTGESNEKNSVREALIIPTVTCVFKVWKEPLGLRPAILVSLYHEVDSASVCPNRAILVRAEVQKLEPVSERLRDPVTAELAFNCLRQPSVELDELDEFDKIYQARGHTVSLGVSKVVASLRLQLEEPPVMTTCRVARVPRPIRHFTAVSLIHSEASAPVWPCLAATVCIMTPNWTPRSVILMEPVPAAFA